MDSILSTIETNTHYCFIFDSTVSMKQIYFEKGSFNRNM